MHQIVLLTAMTAASGLFGGGRSCNNGQCANGYQWQAAPRQAPAVAYAPPAPTYYAPAPVPAPVAPQAHYYPTAYTYPTNYAAPTTAACPTGTCPRR